MPDSPEIRPLHAVQTHALHHAVRWPAQPAAYGQLPEDAASRNFGAFVGGALTSVISLIIKEAAARFRKFATAPAWQGRGIGAALLVHTSQAAPTAGASSRWCDARQSALAFYQRHGMQPEGPGFDKGNIPYQRLRRPLP